MPTVEPLSYSALDYLKSFGVVAVAVSPSGRVYVCRDPKGAAAAWWTKSEFADAVANASWQNADIVGAASRLQVPITPHDVVLRRVGERVNKIDEEISRAIDVGVLRQFNAEYRKRRLAAKQSRKSFMSYSEARARLRRVIAAALAKGGAIPKSFAVEVFDEIPIRGRAV